MLNCSACNVPVSFDDGMDPCDGGHIFCQDFSKTNPAASVSCNPGGAKFECYCCFGEFLYEGMITGSEGCKCCCGCVETTGRTKCPRMGRCAGTFLPAMLKKAQPSKLSKTLERQTLYKEVSCYLCKEAAHEGLTCEVEREAKEEEKKTNKRKQLEAEMTNMIARTCPHCCDKTQRYDVPLL